MTTTTKMQLTEKEAAERTGLSVHWFRRMRCVGEGPVFRKVGNRCFYPVAELDRYFDERTVRSTSEYKTRRPEEAIAKKRANVTITR